MVATLIPSLREPFIPFQKLYQRHGYAVRLMQGVDPDAIPEPERSLLVHENDMTNTLQTFHEDEIRLRPLRQDIDNNVLSRLVSLELVKDGRPVEFGAIQVDLSLLDAEPRRLVEEAIYPFGGILNRHEIQYICQPSAFFRAEADGLMQRVFHIPPGPELYGRCNTISLPGGEALAHVIEILPPGQARTGGLE